MQKCFFIKQYGPQAWLVTAEEHETLIRLSQLAIPDLEEWVVGFKTLLLIFRKSISKTRLEDLLERGMLQKSEDMPEPTCHKVKVNYNGPDLAEVSATTGLSIPDIISLHCTPTYQVRFLGFSPGFAYLDGLDPRLVLPRRSKPRPRMEKGAVAIGGPHTGIYTVPSPGGWNWLGRTDHLLFDPTTESIALKPGDRIRFLPQND